MVNLIIIAVIFIIIFAILAGFIAQQFYTVQKIKATRPKTLLEKMGGGAGALATDKFKAIVMSSGPQASQVESLVDGSSGGRGSQFSGVAGELPDEEILKAEYIATSMPLNIENKNLQTIYAESLSAKNLNPFDVEPDFKLGVAYLKFGQYDKAQNQFQKVVDAKPEFPGIYYYLGEAFRCNGQFYEAMKSYKKSWEMEMAALHAEEDKGKALK